MKCTKCNKEYKTTSGASKKLCPSCTQISRRKRYKEILVKYKGSKCEICGYEKCIQALEFHHTDPSCKDFQLSSNDKGLDKLMKEVDKCILICANCHRELHYVA